MNSNLQNLWEEVRELSFGTIPQIDRLHTPPNPLQFLRHYLSQNKPFILSASAATTLRWPATTLWTSTPYLLQTLSSSTVSLHLTPTGHADSLTPHPSNPNSLCFASAHVTRTSFPDAIDAIQNNNGFVGYAQQQNDCFREEYGALAGDCDSDISWVTEAIGGLPEAVNLWIGNELSETSFHKDHYENLYAVITGEKHFVLLPPTDVHRMYVREYPAAQYNYSRETGEFKLEIENPQRNVPWCSVNPYPLPENKEKEMSNFPLYFNGPKPFEITVKAGEILYLPSMWFHHVRQTPDSRGLTIAVNYWYDMQFDIKYAYFNFLQSLPTPLQPASHDPLTNENASRPIKQSNTSSSKNPSTPVSASDDRNFNINDEDKDDEVNLEDDGVQELARPSGRRSKNKGENVADSSSKRVEEGTREDVFQLNDMFGRFEIESKERHTPIRVNANANARLADSYGLRQVERDI